MSSRLKPSSAALIFALSTLTAGTANAPAAIFVVISFGLALGECSQRSTALRGTS
jgi:hypothetical protein